MTEEIKYIFECGCIGADFIRFKNYNLCPEHRKPIESKIRTCCICGKECHVSKMCNSATYKCDACQPVVKHRVKKVLNNENPISVKNDQAEDIDFRICSSLAEMALNAKFPPLVMPSFSSEFKETFLV